MHHTIEVEDLRFGYPDGTEALRGVSLDIGPGERVALVGPNGAGKSTLMLNLNGLLRPTAGKIRIAGLPLKDETLPEIRARVGLVFQNPDDQLFNPRVFDDVAFGPLHMGLPEDEVRRRSEDALAAVGMTDYSDHISHHLSLGQKKRVAIATVLSMSPEILVLDEPTAGLDPRARRSFIDLLGQMPWTLLTATHDMRFVQALFPRMVVLDGGCIVADGPTGELLADTALLDAHGLERA